MIDILPALKDWYDVNLFLIALELMIIVGFPQKKVFHEGPIKEVAIEFRR